MGTLYVMIPAYTSKTELLFSLLNRGSRVIHTGA